MYINRSKNSKVTALGHHQWLLLNLNNAETTDNVTRPEADLACAGNGEHEGLPRRKGR
jgi:hypothetical protein